MNEPESVSGIAPSLVLDVELSAPLTDVPVPPPYGAAHLLLRWKRSPVGFAWLDAHDGVISAARIRREVEGEVSARINARRFAEWLAVDPLDAQPLPSATVAICTRDRPDDLVRCLTAVCALPEYELPPQEFDIVVVDSASRSDETRQVVARFPRARYVREERAGLDRARNRALREARTEVVAFVDDDAVVDNGWLTALRREFDDPRTLCVSGLAGPLELESPAQVMFERTNAFERGFERRVHDGATDDCFFVARVGAGVNMALRRSLLPLVGSFDDALDAGTPSRSGGDHDMFTRILAAGYRIVYQPDALVRHRHRRSWGELRDTVRGYGTGVYAYLTRHALRGEIRAPFVALMWLPSQLKAVLRGAVSPAHRALGVLAIDELRGCVEGPSAYLQGRKLELQQLKASAPTTASNESQERTEGNAQRPRLDETDDAQLRALNVSANAAAPRLPRLSVVIPTHNRRESLLRLLSVLGADAYPVSQIEVVVVADGCTDGTATAVREYAAPFAVRVEEITPGRGPAVARNHGARVSTGERLLFLDDDMEPFPSMLAAHAHAADDEVLIGAPVPARSGPEASLHEVAMWSWWELQLQQIQSPAHRYTHEDLFSGVVSMSRALFTDVQGFEESLACREDSELGVRLLQRDVRIALSRAAGGHHRELRDAPRLAARKRAEGRADVQLARLHPALWPSLRVSWPLRPWWTAMGVFRRLAFAVPALGTIAARALGLMLHLLERVRARGAWRAVHAALAYYWYWRGVADSTSARELRALAIEFAAAMNARTVRERTVDLSDGLSAIERGLDADAVDALRVTYRGAAVGRIDAVAGAEALRGVHLRAALRDRLASTLIPMLEKSGALPS